MGLCGWLSRCFSFENHQAELVPVDIYLKRLNQAKCHHGRLHLPRVVVLHVREDNPDRRQELFISIGWNNFKVTLGI